jgi:hypothetical protein
MNDISIYHHFSAYDVRRAAFFALSLCTLLYRFGERALSLLEIRIAKAHEEAAEHCVVKSNQFLRSVDAFRQQVVERLEKVRYKTVNF